MTEVICNGKLVMKDCILEGYNLYISDGKITAVTDKSLPADSSIDAGGAYVAPGFVDIHLHGAGGYDFLDNSEIAYREISRVCASHGATTIIPTITSSTCESVIESSDIFEKVKDNPGGARLEGLHLEGPYFAMSQKGAQEERFIKSFDKPEYDRIIKSCPSLIRWTAAPELDGAEEFGHTLTKHGIYASIGHSDAESTVAHRAFEFGFRHVTHLYSCTSSVHRKNAFRYAGIVEEAYLNDDMTVEIIADGIHLPADLLRLVYKLKGPEKTALVTDSMRGAGMPDGKSVIGALDNGLEVIIEDGVAKLPDRSAFAGSVASCDRLVRNMVELAGVPLWYAVTMASATPASVIGIKDRGELKEGMLADVVIFDENINVHRTIVGGKTVFENI